MNKIVLSLLTLSFSGFVYSQAATAWSGEKKIGEYRKNPVTGNIEYYETNNKPKYSAPVYDTSYLQELAERRTAIANHYISNAQRALELSKNSFNNAQRALNRDDFDTAKLEYYDAYLYLKKAIEMPYTRSSAGAYADLATAYAMYLTLVKDDNEFYKMYDYNKIKRANGDISFLNERYNKIKQINKKYNSQLYESYIFY